jgi:hypothetical protein
MNVVASASEAAAVRFFLAARGDLVCGADERLPFSEASRFFDELDDGALGELEADAERDC